MSTNVTAIDQATIDLTAEVAAETTVEQSAIALIDGFAAQISAANASGDAVQVKNLVELLAIALIDGFAAQISAANASGDAVQVKNLVEQIKAIFASLAAAVAANTIASPAAGAVSTANLTPAAASLVQKVASAPSNQVAPVASEAVTS